MATIAELEILLKARGFRKVKQELTTMQRLVGRIQRSIAAFGAVIVTRQLLNGLKNITQELGKISRGMAEISRTTGMTQVGIRALRGDLLELSKVMAGSMDDIQGAAIAFGRAGVTVREELLAGIKVASMMGTITEQSFEKTADSLISLSRIFGATDLRENINEIAGAAVVVGRKFSVTTDEIILAVQRMGGAIAALRIPERDAILLTGALAEVSGRASLAGRQLNAALVAMTKNLGKVGNLLGMTTIEAEKLFATDPLEFLLQTLEALGKIDNEVERFQEEFKIAGTIGAKALGPLVDRAGDLRNKLSELNAEFDQGDPLLRDYEKAIKNLGFYLERLGDTFRVALIKGFLEIEDVIVDFVKSLTNILELLEPIFQLLMKTINILKAITKPLRLLTSSMSKLSGFIVDITDSRFIELLEDISPALKKVGINIDSIIKKIKLAAISAGKFGKVTGDTGKKTKQTFFDLKAYLDVLEKESKSAFGNIRNSFESAFSTALFDAITGRIRGLRDIIKSFAKDVLKTFTDLVAKLTTEMALRGLFGDLFLSGTPGEFGKLGGVFGKLGSFFGGGNETQQEQDLVQSQLNEKIAGTTENLKKFDIQKDKNIQKFRMLGEKVEEIRQFLPRLASAIATAWGKITQFVAFAWQGAMKIVITAAQQFLALLSKGGGGFWSKFLGIGLGILGGVLLPGVGSLLGGAIGGIAKGIGGFFGGGAGALPAGAGITMAVPTPLAEGGIVRKPTLGLVGESGPEAIMPLNKAGMMGGITLNFNDVVFLEDDASMDRFVRKIAPSIVRASKRQTGGTAISLSET